MRDLRTELETLIQRESDTYWAKGGGGAATATLEDLRSILDGTAGDVLVTRAATVDAFLLEIERSGAYNGSLDDGQRFYDWGLNPWLRRMRDQFLRRQQ